MDKERTIAVLRDLLKREQQNPSIRLREASVFISSVSARLQEAIRMTATSSFRNCEMLTDVLQMLGGEPGPRAGCMFRNDPNYVELSAIWPDFIKDFESLLAAYRKAQTFLAGEPDAAATVSRIADEHQKELTLLRSLKPGELSEPALV